VIFSITKTLPNYLNFVTLQGIYSSKATLASPDEIFPGWLILWTCS